jgi:hypothetical protein
LTEWIENLLAALVSLRFFGVKFDTTKRIFPQGHLPFAPRAFDRAPHLKYMVMHDMEEHYWKRDREEWVLCDQVEFYCALAAYSCSEEESFD